jgi:hypothetical protein
MKITIKGLVAGALALLGVAMAVPEAQAMPVQPLSPVVTATEAPAAQVEKAYFYGYRRPFYRYGYGFRRPFYGWRRPYGFRRFYGYRRPFYRYGWRRW